MKYSQKNGKCNCYWPEYSSQAAKISDAAYLLFRDLIKTTALGNFLNSAEEQRDFIENPGWFLNEHGLSISFVAQQFRFSDYYHICKDIENYAVRQYSREQAAEIKDKLEDIIEALYPRFFSLYTTCFKNHPNDDIKQEIIFMKLLVNDISALEDLDSLNMSINLESNPPSYDRSELLISNLLTEPLIEKESKGIRAHHCHLQLEDSIDLTHQFNMANQGNGHSFTLQSEILLEQGTILNNFMLYKKAIEVLTQAIKLDSANREAYIERMMAYFETNQIKLALRDYDKIQKIADPPFKINQSHRLIPKHKQDFAKGLIKGTLSGCQCSATEMIPSILSCCRGILHGLWAFASSPREMSQEMIDTAYAIGEYINSHDAIECLECVVPELKELARTWHKIDDYSRGQKIGYIIGKYGLEILAPLGAVKGIAKLRALKRANTLYTVEMCALSKSNRRVILEESAKMASIRAGLIQNSKAGKIIPRNSNVAPHIMGLVA